MFKLILIIMALFIGVVVGQNSPNIQFMPGSKLTGGNSNKLNGQFGIDAHIPITPDFSVSGQYNRVGDMTGRRHIDNFKIMGKYRFRF